MGKSGRYVRCKFVAHLGSMLCRDAPLTMLWQFPIVFIAHSMGGLVVKKVWPGFPFAIEFEANEVTGIYHWES